MAMLDNRRTSYPAPAPERELGGARVDAPAHRELEEDLNASLRAWSTGKLRARDRSLQLAYEMLKRIAARLLRNERHPETLEPAALVNEFFLRVAERPVNWQDRDHFFAGAARIMRHILIDRARHRRSYLRTGHLHRVTLNEALIGEESPTPDTFALTEMLDELSSLDPQQARVVNLRFFLGLSIQETAKILGISTATVKRDWKKAKDWLFLHLGDHINTSTMKDRAVTLEQENRPAGERPGRAISLSGNMTTLCWSAQHHACEGATDDDRYEANPPGRRGAPASILIRRFGPAS